MFFNRIRTKWKVLSAAPPAVDVDDNEILVVASPSSFFLSMAGRAPLREGYWVSTEFFVVVVVVVVVVACAVFICSLRGLLSTPVLCSNNEAINFFVSSFIVVFYLVLLNFTGFLLGFTGFYWVLLGFTGFYWVSMGFT